MAAVKCLLIDHGIKAVAHRERLTTTYDFPNGILSLGSFLEANGCSVAIVPLDYHLNISYDPEDLDKRILSILEPALKEYDPLFVGVGVAYTMLYPVSLKIVELSKALKPGAVTGLGGPHVSYMDRQCFEDSSAVDVVVRGEGEWTLLELINTLDRGGDLSGVKGVTHKKNGEIIVNPPRPLGPVDELPVLDFGLMPEGFIRGMAVSIVASRGCAYKCTYCNESLFWGNKVRRIPIEKIMEELKQLADKYDNYPVGLEDSMFHMKSSYFFEMLASLAGIRLNPAFYLLSRADCVTQEGCEAMFRAGIGNLVLGLESASPKVLKAMNKQTTIERGEDACAMATRKGLIVGTFWMIGHPGDSPVEAQITIDTIDRFYGEGIMGASEIALFVPYPGGAVFNDPGRFGVEILTYDWERWARFNTQPVCQLEDFSKDEIIAAWKKAKGVDEKWRFIQAYAHSETGEDSAPGPKGKVGRNDPCPCGSGRKYKKCCGR